MGSQCWLPGGVGRPGVLRSRQRDRTGSGAGELEGSTMEMENNDEGKGSGITEHLPREGSHLVTPPKRPVRGGPSDPRQGCRGQGSECGPHLFRVTRLINDRAEL